MGLIVDLEISSTNRLDLCRTLQPAFILRYRPEYHTTVGHACCYLQPAKKEIYQHCWRVFCKCSQQWVCECWAERLEVNREEDMISGETETVVVPGPGCPPAESTWPGLHPAALHSHSAAPPESHRAAVEERRQHETRTPMFQPDLVQTHTQTIRYGKTYTLCTVPTPTDFTLQ